MSLSNCVYFYQSSNEIITSIVVLKLENLWTLLFIIRGNSSVTKRSGGWCVRFPRKKRYEGVRYNVIRLVALRGGRQVSNIQKNSVM